MAQQTAINWLRKKLEETYDKEGKLPLAYTFSLLNKAEQIEKEQIIQAFDIACEDKDRIGEEYYNETFTSTQQDENPSATRIGQS